MPGRRSTLAGAPALLLAGAGVFLAAGGCGRKAAPDDDDVLGRYRGRTLVLLMGMPKCPGTAKASRFLSEYAREKPEGVALLQLDVRPPGGWLPGELALPTDSPAPTAAGKEAVPGDAGLAHEVDRGRAVADRLAFFYYPTLYILDRDGKVRFRGGCEPDRVRRMVAEIRAERPGAPKRVYTPPLPAVGSPAAAFAGKDLDGRAVSLRTLRGDKATLLFFGSTTCPYSTRAVPGLPALKAEFKGKGAEIVIVNIGKVEKTTRSFYAEKAPRITVVADEGREISEKKYGVRTVPYLYVIDKAGKVAARRAYTPAAARASLAKSLGLKPPRVRLPSSGAG